MRETPKTFAQFQIEDLDISVRALNSIRQAGIKTTDELFSLDERQMALLNFSNRTIIEINRLCGKQ